MSTFYGRVENGVVIDFPLSKADINSRNNPTDSYYPAVYGPLGEYDQDYQRIVETPILIGNAIFVMRAVLNKCLEDVVSDIVTIAGVKDETGNLIGIDFALIPTSKLNAAIKLICDRVQAFMDNFAQSRLYDDMGALCGYNGSTDTKFIEESARGNYLRDMTWRNLYAYLDAIKAGTQPVPMSWYEISQVLPPLTWE